MKRSLFIAIAVLLMAALFVGCNADKLEEDQLFEVTIEGDSRALDVTSEASVDNPADLYWYYTAEKKDTFFTTGQTTEQKAVQAGKGIAGASLGSFSRGDWEFKFYAYDKDKTDSTATLIYSAETRATVGRTALVLSLTLKAEVERKSEIFVDGVSFDMTTIPDSDYTKAELKVTLGSVNKTVEGVLSNSKYIFTSTDALFTDVAPGHYTIGLEVIGFFGTNESERIGYNESEIEVASGTKYTITDNLTNPGIKAFDSTSNISVGDLILPATKTGSDSQTISGTGNTTFEVAVSPEDGDAAKTTVLFPQGSVSPSEATLAVVAYNSAAAEGNFSIVGSDNKSLGGLSLTLSGTSEFESAVTVSTYIGTGLTGPFTVIYDGEGAQPTNVTYNATDGFISFNTTHFSDFYVFEAEAKIEDEYYASLKDAVAAATPGSKIVLVKDVKLSQTVEISKNLEIDLNGFNIDANDARALWVKEGAVSITGNGTISSSNGGTLATGSSVIRVGSGSQTAPAATVAELTIGSGVTVSSNHCYGITVFGNNVGSDVVGQKLTLEGKVRVTGDAAAISGNGNSWNSKTEIVLCDGAVVYAAQDYAIYHPQAGTFTVNGASITGLGGVELKSGSVAVIGLDAEIRATGTPSHQKNNDGTSTSGYAVAAVENSGYIGGAIVTISGGSFYGPVEVIIDDEATNKATITVTGGSFTDASVFDYLADGASIKLLSDITADRLYISNSAVLDLNGKGIKGRVTADNGTVVLKNGTIEGRVDAYDSSNLTLDSDLTVLGQVVVWGWGTIGQSGCKTPVLKVLGRIEDQSEDAGISTNGTDLSEPIINILDGAQVISDDVAVYLPSGNATISGGTITGTTAVYFKASKLKITGGTLNGVGAAVDYKFNGNGANATGDALVLDNCDYPAGVDYVKISGGSFNSTNAKSIGYYEGPNFDADYASKVEITGGSFNPARTVF